MLRRCFLSLLCICLFLFGCEKGSAPDTSVPHTTEPIIAVYPVNSGYDFSEYSSIIPDIIYSTTGSENGLPGNLYEIVGTVDRIHQHNGITCYIIKTSSGEVAVGSTLESLKQTDSTLVDQNIDTQKLQQFFQMPQIGEYVRIYAEYSGYSNAIELPAFKYGGDKYLTYALMQSLDPVNETTDSDTEQFQLGNIIFTIPDGFELMYADDGVAVIVPPERECAISLAAIDISELSEDRVPIYLPQQHQSFLTEGTTRIDEQVYTFPVADFNVNFNYCIEYGAMYDVSVNFEATFTDSWYAYTILSRISADVEDGYPYGKAFGEFVSTAQYVGKPPRFETVQ